MAIRARMMARIAATLVALLMLICPSAHATIPASSSTASRVSAGHARTDALLRRESLAFALGELNRIASLGFPGAPPEHLESPPVYALHSVHSEAHEETLGALVRKVPVYRTVRGFDEKRRRPIIYQTLTHEDQPYSAVVDTTWRFHLVLRRRGTEELAERQRARVAAAAAHECLVDDDSSSTSGSCAPLVPPAPASLIHAIVSVSTDRDGSSAVTGLRSASTHELRGWWGAYLARQRGAEGGDEAALAQMSARHGTAGAAQTLSAAYAEMQAAHLAAHETYLRPLPARLQNQPAYAAPAGSTPLEGRLRVVSANIFNFNHWPHRQTLLEEALRNSGDASDEAGSAHSLPDLIGFQEVRALKSDVSNRSPPHEGRRFQVEDLSRLLPQCEFHYEAAMGFRESGGEYVAEGLALFSCAWPLTQVEWRKLSRDPLDKGDFHQRMVLHARANTPWGGIHILTTHLSLSAGAQKRTLPELGLLANSLLPEPSVVVGDFNAPYALGPASLAGGPFWLRDAWVALNGHSIEEDRRGWTFHSWERRSRIDFVLFNSRAEDEEDEEQQASSSSSSGSAAASPFLSLVREGHATNPSLLPLRARVLGATGHDVSPLRLGPVGGIVDLKDTMYASDHMFPCVDFRVRKLVGERAAAVEQVSAARVAAAGVATDAASSRIPPLPPGPIPPPGFPGGKVPLVAGIGFKDEL